MMPVRVRPRASTEIDTLADYIAHDNRDAAIHFLNAVKNTLELIGEQPGIGSLRYAHLPMLQSLRMLTVSGFESYLVFYIERPTYIDILRVLHGARDIPAVILDN